MSIKRDVCINEIGCNRTTTICGQQLTVQFEGWVLWFDIFSLVATETDQNEFVQPPRPIFGIADFLKFTTESSELGLKNFSVAVLPEVGVLGWLSISFFAAVWHRIVLLRNTAFFFIKSHIQNWRNIFWPILWSLALDFLTQFLDLKSRNCVKKSRSKLHRIGSVKTQFLI